MNDKEQAYLLFRLFFGVTFFLHGFVDVYSRMPGITWTDGFSGLIALIGLLMTVGLLTRIALWAGSLLMILLVLGVALLGEWSSVADQLLYSISFFILLYNLSENKASLDTWIGTRFSRKIGFD